MRRARLILAMVVLAGVFMNASAKAAVFDFSFGSDAQGTFTTGAAASDPGYELITALIFDRLAVTIGGEEYIFTDLAATDLAAGAAFNPRTHAFINHAGEGPVNDIGLFSTPRVPNGSNLAWMFQIDGQSFSTNFPRLQGVAIVTYVGLGPSTSRHEFRLPGSLIVRAAPSEALIPEPSTWR